MGLKSALGKLFGKGRHGLAGASGLEPIDMAAGVKKPDEELYEACVCLKTIAEGIVSESGRRPPDPSTQVAAITASCNKAATDWLNSNYGLPELLADAYGKSWSDSAIGQETATALGQASAISDPQVAASLLHGMQLVAIAAAAMMVHGVFVMSRNPQAAEATKTAADMAAAAKTYALGL